MVFEHESASADWMVIIEIKYDCIVDRQILLLLLSVI